MPKRHADSDEMMLEEEGPRKAAPPPVRSEEEIVPSGPNFLGDVVFTAPYTIDGVTNVRIYKPLSKLVSRVRIVAPSPDDENWETVDG
jgi:hypothetical protein